MGRRRMRRESASSVLPAAALAGLVLSIALTAASPAWGVRAPAPEPSASTASPTSSPPPTPQPTPDATTAAPTPAPTDTVEPTPTPTPTPTASPAPTSAPIPPAVTTTSIGLPTLLIAIGVVVAGGVLVWLLARRPHAPPAVAAASAASPGQPAPVVLESMAALGTAMIDSGYPVGLVRGTLEDMARADGLRAAQAVVFPTSILVSSGDGGSAQTRAVTAGERAALLHQVDAVDRIAGVARTRPANALWVRRQLARMRALPVPFTVWQRVGAYALLSGALAVLLGSSLLGVVVAAGLGLAVGAALLATDRLGAVHRTLAIVAVSLGVSISVLLVARFVDAGALPAIAAPLIMLLPGGLLTIAAIELATGDIMSGAARVAAGAMRLILLATGIVAAGALLGVPAIPGEAASLGPIAPWIAVAVFGVGIGVYQCAKPASIAWIIVVLYVAYGAQVIGDVFFDGVLSALVGAAAMTPVAIIVARQRTGPPALVSFLPAFWLLVPGALGLIGVAGVLEGDSSGVGTIVATIATMVSIALGVLIGLAAMGSVHGLRHAPPEDWMTDEPDDVKTAG